MKYLLFAIVPLLMLSISCENGSTNGEITETTDSLAIVPKDTLELPDPALTTPYFSLSPSTYVAQAGNVEEYQAELFLKFITPKQKEQTDKQTDTLYSVSYLPYKDQEIYIYQSVENDTIGQWCVAIIKNGEVMTDGFAISVGKYRSVTLDKMEVGDKELKFTATRFDNSTYTIVRPYDGKTLGKKN